MSKILKTRQISSGSRSKCRWCWQHYSSAGQYENHVRDKHPEQYATLASSSVSLWRERILGEPWTTDESGPAEFVNEPMEFADEPSELDAEFNNYEDETASEQDPQSQADAERVHDSDEEEQVQEVIDLEHDMDLSACQEYPVELAAGKSHGVKIFSNIRDSTNLLSPFQTADEFKLARWFIRSKVPKTQVDAYFGNRLHRDFLSSGSDSPRMSFKSGHTLWGKLKEMKDEPEWFRGDVDYPLEPNREIWYRNIIDCVHYLVQQRAFVKDLVWAPIRETNPGGERVYSDLHTANWWWETQQTLGVGKTLIPVLLGSDQTHLTNYSGDKKLWPIYISVGNIRAEVRNKPAAHAWIPFAMLPIAPKRRSKVAQQSISQQELDALAVTHDTLRAILSPLADAVASGGYLFHCADEEVRECVPILCSWLADHMENAQLHAVSPNRCMVCTAPRTELGAWTAEGYPSRPYMDYKRAFEQGDRASLQEDGIKMIENALWSIPGVVPSDLVRPDLLHNIYLGLLPDVIEWSLKFLDHHQRLSVFDDIWCSIPPYPGLSLPRKPIRSVTQWQGKEMRNFGRVFLAAFAASLRRRTDKLRTQGTGGIRCAFSRAIRCVRHFTDFHLLSQYRQHTDQTVQYMVRELERFHAEKDVFLRWRAGKQVKEIARRQKSALGREQEVRGESAVESMTSAQKRQLREADRDEREALEEEILTGHSHFNYPKMHMLSHYADQISRFGTLLQFSTEICESSHKLLKDAYRRSNHINATPQILQTYTRQHSMDMRESNLRAWASTIDVGDEVRSVLGQYDDGNPNRYVPRLRLFGKESKYGLLTLQQATEIFEIEDLLDLTIEFLEGNKSRSGSDSLSSKQLMDASIEVFNSLRIDVPVFQEDFYMTQVVRATAKASFRGQRPRSDWVWVRVRSASGEEPAGSLRGRVSARMNMIFKIRHPLTQQVYRLTHVTLTEPIGGNSPRGEEGMIIFEWKKVRANRVIRISEVEGIAHLVPINEEERWLQNNRIDLGSWNDIYENKV